MGNGWTPERRARQAELIRQLQPWKKSTGPRSPKGKAAASRNAWKGGFRPMIRELAKVLREQDYTRRSLAPQLAKTCDTTPDSASFSDSGKP